MFRDPGIMDNAPGAAAGMERQPGPASSASMTRLPLV